MAEHRKEKKNRQVMLAVTMLLAVVLCTFIYLGIEIWNKYKNTIIDNQKKHMLTIAQNVADNFEVFIKEYCADLDTLSSVSGNSLAAVDAADWGSFLAYTDTHSQFVYDVWLENPDGEVIKSAQALRSAEVRGSYPDKEWLNGAALYPEDSPREYYSDVHIDARTSLRQCQTEKGRFALVIRRELQDGSGLAIIIDAKAYYHDLISNLQLGTNGYVMLKDTEGIILMHPEENQWGINVIEGRMELYDNLDLTSLETMIVRQNKGEMGIEEYYSYWWLKPELPRVKKISAFCPARLGSGFIVVSAVMDYNDAYIPVVEGLFKLILVFLGILGVIAFMGFYILRLMRQRERVTKEVTYLRELNRILEEMHQSEELIAHQQRLQIMGTMTGGIAHEFNNLLTPIMGYSELLLMEIPEASSAHESVLEIHEASLKAKEMIQQISSLSRRNIETAYKTIQVAKMLQRSLKMVQSVCPVNIHLENLTTFGDACILGNETQMNQVILNICVNAIQAIGQKKNMAESFRGEADGVREGGGNEVGTDSAEGYIRVTGEVVAGTAPDSRLIGKNPENWQRYVRITISDDGCGMTEDTVKQIFDPFFTTKKGGVGTGLGLALVEQIITSHKGYIFAESEPGQGSEFHIYLPLGNQQEQERQIMELEDQEAFSLVIVDDNPKVLKLLEKAFAKSQMEVFFCMDFDEVRRVLAYQPVNAIVTETNVSGVSAFDFFMSVMAMYPGLLKIIMIDRVSKEIAEAKRRGIVDEYIDKPVSDATILEAIVKHQKSE